MKFKVIQTIEAEFESDTFDKVKMFECISEKYEDAIFAPIKYDVEELCTVISDDGTILRWDKNKREFLNSGTKDLFYDELYKMELQASKDVELDAKKNKE